MLQHDALHTGQTHATKTTRKQPQIAWKVDVRALTDHIKTPVVGKHGICVTGLYDPTMKDGHYTHALHLVDEKGRIKNTFTYPSSYRSPVTSPALSPDESVVYFYAPITRDDTDVGILHALSVKDWRLLWKTEIERGGTGPGSITVDPEGNIYIGLFRPRVGGMLDGTGGKMVSVSPDGKIRWSLGGYLYFSTPSVDIDRRIVYVLTRDTRGKGYLIAMNMEGEQLWRLDNAQVQIHTLPHVGHGGMVFYPVKTKGETTIIHGVRARLTPKGFVFTSVRYDTRNYRTYWANPAVSRDGLLHMDANTGNNGSALVTFHISSGKEMWRYVVPYPFLSSPPALDGSGRLYFVDTEGNLYCLNGEDGILLWKMKIGEGAELHGSAPAIGDDGTIYIIDGDGWLYAVD